MNTEPETLPRDEHPGVMAGIFKRFAVIGNNVACFYRLLDVKSRSDQSCSGFSEPAAEAQVRYTDDGNEAV